MGKEYELYTKGLFGAFILFLTINLISYYLDEYNREEKREKQEQLVLEKKREDQKQDSLLIVLDAKIDNYLIKKDTILARETINLFFHTSDFISPYESDSFFSEKKHLSYKEYWQQKRKEKLEKLEGTNEDSFFSKFIN